MNSRITEAEWEVMECLWTRGNMAANEIFEAIRQRKSWTDKTVKSLINRLLNKEVISFVKKGRRYEYYPLVERSHCIQVEKRSFLERLFGGRPMSAIVHFINEEQLTREEIDELKQMLDEKRSDS
ncbi:BlaI/MecI/CopY family transcriptional regulator [Paenibacillus tarimensis]